MYDLKTLVRPNIATLEPYRCARDDYKEGILLDANENTHGPALDRIGSWEDALQLNRYPDPHQTDLKQQIVDFRNQRPNVFLKDAPNLSPQNLCLGVGLDESIDMLLRCVCIPGRDKLLVCPPTYGMYSICACVNDVELVKVPLTMPEFQVDCDAVLQTIQQDASIKLIYITSPGNPTGKLVSVQDIVGLAEKARERWNGLVVVDEAYIDFTEAAGGKSQSMSTLVKQLDNLVVMQTLSKSFGLAGIRLGITFCNEALARILNAMKYPYNISLLTSAVATRSTEKGGLLVMAGHVELIRAQRQLVAAELARMEGIGQNIGGMDANFVLVQVLNKDGVPCNQTAKQVYTDLATSDSVVVRFRGTELNCTGALRISIGTEQENRIMLQKLATALERVRGK